MIKLLSVLLIILEVIYAAPPYNLFANSSDKELLLLGEKFDEFAVLLEQGEILNWIFLIINSKMFSKVLSRKNHDVDSSEDGVNDSLETGKGLLSAGNKLSIIDRIRNRLTTTGPTTTTGSSSSSTTSATTTTATTPTPPAGG